MPLKGSLKEFSLPDLFQLIHFGRKNGTLSITSGEARGYVCFREGNVFFATHNWKGPTIGQRLVQSGMVKDYQIEEALGLQRTTRKGQCLGNILVELGYLARESLEVFVEEQIRNVVFNLLRWTEGQFDFDPNQVFPEEDIGLSISTEDLIMEGSRRQDEWHRIEKKMHTLDAVFTVIKVPGGDTPDINLTSEEWLALYHVDGEHTVGEIVEKSGQSAMTTCKAIYGLAAAGLIAPVGAEGEKIASPVFEDVEEEITGSREKLTELKKAAADLVGAGRVEEVVVGGPEDELADIVVVEEPSLAEQVKEEKPGGGQSVIDYYKSLAIEDVTSAEREIAFKDTGETVDEEVAGEEEPSVGGRGILEEPVSDYEQPDEIPLEWAGQIARLRGVKSIYPLKDEGPGAEKAEAPEEEKAVVPEEASTTEPAEGILEVPLVGEEPSGAAAPLPSEEEIAKLLQDTVTGRGELSREELLAFDQPTYSHLEAREATSVLEGVGVEEPGGAGTTEGEDALAEAPTKGKSGILGKVLKFRRTASEEETGAFLEQPEPVVKAGSAYELSAAQELEIPVVKTRDETAASVSPIEGLVAEREAAVDGYEEIPLVSAEAPGEEVTLVERPDVEVVEIEDSLEEGVIEAEEEVLEAEGPEAKTIEVAPLTEEELIEDLGVTSGLFNDVTTEAAGLEEEVAGEESPKKQRLAEEEDFLSSIRLGGKREAGTSLVDLESFELEQDLIELVGNGEKKKRIPIKEKKSSTENKKSSKEKKGSVLNRTINIGFGGSKSKGGKEVDRGSV